MSTWNYRLTVQTVKDGEVWGVREIYYDDAGNPTSWSAEPLPAFGESWKECADDLARMAGVVGHPALDLDTKRWCDRNRQERALSTSGEVKP